MAFRPNSWDHLGFPHRTVTDLTVEGHRDPVDPQDLVAVFPPLARVDQACLLEDREDQDFLAAAEVADLLHLPRTDTMGVGILKTPRKNGERRVP